MKIQFIEEIDLALRETLDSSVTSHRRFKRGNMECADFIGEDSDLETIDFQIADGRFALRVPRLAVAVTRQ